MIRKCKHHGLTEFRIEKRSNRKDSYRCIKCGVIAMNKRRIGLKLKAVELLGGECEICGYNKYHGALEFHHKNPEDKSFGIGDNMHSHSWSEIVLEVQKCRLLCSNCHREIHGGVAE